MRTKIICKSYVAPISIHDHMQIVHQNNMKIILCKNMIKKGKNTLNYTKIYMPKYGSTKP